MKFLRRSPHITGISICCLLLSLGRAATPISATPDGRTVTASEQQSFDLQPESLEHITAKLRTAGIANRAEVDEPFRRLVARPDNLLLSFERAIVQNDQVLAVQLAYALRLEDPSVALPAAATAGRLISSESKQVSLMAIESAGLIGVSPEDVVRPLIKASKNSDVRVRYRAVAALGRLRVPPESVYQALAAASDDESRVIAQRAEQSLLALRTSPSSERDQKQTQPARASLRITTAAKSEEPPAVSGAPLFIKRTESAQPTSLKTPRLKAKDEKRLRAVLLDLGSKDSRTRAEAAMSAASLGLSDPRLLSELEDRLHDKDERVRFSASYALGHIGHASVPILARAMTDDDPSVRLKAALALKGMEPISPDVLNALIPGLSDPDDAVRLQSAVAITSASPAHEEALMALVETLGMNHAAIPAAAPALKRVDLETAIPTLMSALRSEDATLRRGAARALSAMGASAAPATDALLPLLKDDNESVRKSAELALANIQETN